MRERVKLLLAVLTLATLSACGVPIHDRPTVVPKDKVPFHLSDSSGSKLP